MIVVQFEMFGAKGNFEGLPVRFVSSMKILFDILDDGETGYILFSDLEKWWDATDGTQSDDRPVIPADALEALRRITPPNGRLSFDRFIAGLKLSLLKLRLQNSVPVPKQKVNLVSANALSNGVHNGYHHDFYSEQNLHMKADTVKVSETTDASAGFFDLRRQRTNSMSRLSEMRATTAAGSMRSSNSPNSDPEKNMIEGGQSNNEKNGSSPSWNDKRLQSLQDNMLLKLEKSKTSSAGNQMSDGKDTERGDQHQVSRRHTLTSGIGYNFIPIMRLMQQEKEMLLRGLESVETARSWYLHRLKALHEKQRNFEKASLPSDYSLQANKERIEFEKLRITSVIQELNALVSSSDKLLVLYPDYEYAVGSSEDQIKNWKRLPTHMNLAISEAPQTQKNYANEMDALKMRNQILTKELGQKAKVIAKLEKEKVILVKEMFQAKTRNSSEEMTLI